MTTYDIDRLSAVTADHRPVHVPTTFTPNELVSTLRRLSLTIPNTLSAVAAKGQPLSASRHRFTLKEVDAALFERGVGVSERIRIKAAMSQNGIL